MNKINKSFSGIISNIFLIFVSCLLFLSCSDKTDRENATQKQRDAIISFLDGTKKEYAEQNGVFKQIEEIAPEGAKILAGGDSIYIYFAEYLFTSQLGKLFYTNIESLAVEAGFDIATIPLDPLGIKYGTTSLINGLNKGLAGCKEGEIFMLYMPHDMAYGNVAVGVVPPYSAIAIRVEVLSIKKN